MRVTWLALEWPRPGHHLGGVGRYVHRLAAEMRELVDLTVVTVDGAQQMDGVDVVTLPPARGRFGRFYRSPVHARAVVAATRPDVVHAHGDDWALRSDVPVVRTFYGRSWSEARASRGLRRANHVVLAGTELVSARRATRRLAIAPESFDAFRCHLLTPPLAGLRAPLPRAPAAEPSVLFLGSHGGRKRGWLAERTVAEAAQVLGRPVQLVVVGPAEDAHRWGPHVRHRAGLTDAEVAAELARTWLLLAPSSYEGFGIPTVEALHAGVPVVASPNPGSRWIAGQGGPRVPLELVEDDGLPAAVAASLAAGAVRRADLTVVQGMLAASSPGRLVEVYEAVAA